jgi:predicted DNA-binding protein
VTQTVRVPDPVYEQLTAEADRKDVSRGAVVREWMENAEKYNQMEDRLR